MVKEVTPEHIVAQDENKGSIQLPYGLLVWYVSNLAVFYIF
jgi:hypothetical protein